MLEKIGKYEIRRELGRGAMGVVYEGFDTAIGRRVAVKTLRTEMFQPDQLPEVLARFKREAQSAGRLAHPNIVTIYDYGEEQGTPYIVMEYITGHELGRDLARGVRYSLDDIFRTMSQLLGALAHAHENGVVHRDVKPANMFVLENGSLKVVDFGIARVEESELTEAGAIMGTPAYMSPEQFLGLRAEARSDIYSAGVILYQLLTGDKPFSGSATTIMQKVLRHEPLAPSALNPTLSETWDSIVACAMAKKPEARYESARQFAETIRLAYAAGRGVNDDRTRGIEQKGMHLEADALREAELRARMAAEETVLENVEDQGQKTAAERPKSEPGPKTGERSREEDDPLVRRPAGGPDVVQAGLASGPPTNAGGASRGVTWSIGAAVALLAIGGAILYLEQDGNRRTDKPEGNASVRTEARTVAGKDVDERPQAASTSEEAHKQEAPVRDCPDCPKMVAIPAGEFMMGTPVSEDGRFEDEGPPHRVQVKAFHMGKYEVTRGEFDRFVKETGRSMPRCFSSPGFSQNDKHPAVCVSWESARAYAQWLSAKTGERYRLPSEAEWEYAARAGTSTARFWGDATREACRYANVDGTAHGCDDGHEQTAPVGSYAPNKFGLYDMLGNVWEWTEDCWNENYSGAPSDGSTWLAGNCSIRVNRGGSFNYLPRIVRSGKRNKSSVVDRLDDFGFRLARTPQ